MYKIVRLGFLALAFWGVPVGAHAVTIDFAAMANGPTYGESAWNPSLFLTLGGGLTLTVTATYTDLAGSTVVAYPYLDSDTGGLGVCRDASTFGARGGSTSNVCNPSDDDNVTLGETLYFSFNQDVTIDSIAFNNNHDPDYSLSQDWVNIDGTDVAFVDGGVNPPWVLGPYRAG